LILGKKQLVLLRKYPIIYDYIASISELKTDVKEKISIDDNVKALGYYYDDFIVSVSSVLSRSRLPNGAVDMNTMADPKKTFENIVKNYTGILREKFLISFFQCFMISSSTVRSELPKLMDEAMGYFSHADNKEELADLKVRLQEKTKFIDFALVDKKGVTITPSNFNGKITLIDFWYTGCAGCAQVKTRMTEDIERLSKSERFQMMSISIDRDSSVWKRSIASKYYTHSNSIDVYTGGLGKENIIFTRYNVSSFPRLMLVDDKGIIISTSLSPDEAIKTIEDNLKRLRN
jgi:cytochrome oxidase Cu insertion factor (SCO1/SenC/PrrC family)